MATATITPLNLPRGTTLSRACGVLARERLARMLDEALTQTDDLLFKLANSADTTQRQNLCFDAMRELRLKRDGIATAFLAAWETDFNTCRERVRSRERQRARGGDTAAFMGELTLLGQDEVEENLAIANYSAAAHSRSGRELHDLEQRLAALFETPHLDEEHNPLGPQRLGQHLKAALAPLESGTEVKLTLFKMLDRAGGPTLHQLYVELNQKLAAAGILPTLAASTRSTSSHRTRVIIESEAERAEESGTDVLSTLQRLLHGNPAGGLPGIGGTVGGVGGTGGFGGGGFSGNGGGAGIPAGFGGYAAGSGSAGAAPGGFGGGGGHAGGGIPGVSGPATLPRVRPVPSVRVCRGTGMAGGTGGGSASAHGAFPAILGVGAEGGDPAAQVDGVAVPVLVQTLTDLQRTLAPGVETAAAASAGSGTCCARSRRPARSATSARARLSRWKWSR